MAGPLYFNNVPIPGGSSLSSSVAGDISDPDGDTLTFSGSTTTAQGTVDVHPDGTFTYTPTPEARAGAISTG